MAEEKKMIIDGVSCPFTTERNVLENERLQNEKTKLESEVARATKMLSNPGFVNKAPEAKINEEKAKLTKYQEMLDSVNERLKNI